MRIAIWAMPFLPVMGGREVFTARLAGALVGRGHEVVVVAPAHDGPDVPDDDVVDGVRVVRVPVGGLIDVQQLGVVSLPTDVGVATARLAALLDEFAPDLVHAHALAPDLVLLGAQVRPRRVPVVVTDHFLGSSPWLAGLEVTRRAATVPAAFVAVSQAAAGGLRGHLPEVSERLVVIPNGVPLPLAPPPVDPGSRLTLYLGRLSPEKGVAVALTAWSALARGRDEHRFVVAGDGTDRSGLERLARHLGVAEQVTFTGWQSQDQVTRLLAESALVVVPSVWAEPFGLVAAEAAAAGRPVIASRVGGLPEIVRENHTGWLIGAGDLLGLIGMLNGAYADPDGLVAAGATARQHAVEHLGLDTCVDAYVDLYERVLAR